MEDVGKRDAARPDFTGTWTFNPARSTLQIQAPDKSVFVIDHRDPVLRFSRTHTASEVDDTFTIDLSTDGQETAVDRDGMQVLARAYWDGDTLVFDSRLTRSGEEATNVVRYTLSGDWQTIVARERLRSASINYDNVWVLEKSS